MTSIAFGFLAVVLLPLWFIAGIVLVCFKSTRTAGWVLLSTAVALPVVAFFGIFFFKFSSVRTESTGAIEVTASTRPPIPRPASDPRPPTTPASIPDEKSVSPATPETQKRLLDKFAVEAAQLVNKWSRIFAESMSGERKKTEVPVQGSENEIPHSAVSDQHPATAPHTNLLPKVEGTKRPDWIGKTPGAEGDVYLACLTVGPYIDRQECEENRLKELQKAFDGYVAKCRGADWAGKIRLPDKDLLALVAEEYEETASSPSLGRMMTNLHLLVRFDRQVAKQIEDAQRDWIVQRHLRQAGAGLAGLWLALGVVWGYLRLDQRSDGRYRGRLRLAAGAFLGVVAAAVWWATLG